MLTPMHVFLWFLPSWGTQRVCICTKPGLGGSEGVGHGSADDTSLIQTGSTTTDKHISVRRGENLSQEENDVSKPKQRKPGSGSVRKDLHAFRHVLDRLLAPPCMKSIINSFLMGPIGDTAPERYQ